MVWPCSLSLGAESSGSMNLKTSAMIQTLWAENLISSFIRLKSWWLGNRYHVWLICRLGNNKRHTCKSTNFVSDHRVALLTSCTHYLFTNRGLMVHVHNRVHNKQHARDTTQTPCEWNYVWRIVKRRMNVKTEASFQVVILFLYVYIRRKEWVSHDLSKQHINLL